MAFSFTPAKILKIIVFHSKLGIARLVSCCKVVHIAITEVITRGNTFWRQTYGTEIFHRSSLKFGLTEKIWD
eukprot:scaffold10550_cov271-Chaetoceros_neogracile.AAC.70